MSEQLERRIWIDAAPPLVYEFFLNPARLIEWEGFAADVDPRVGGSYRIAISDNASVVGEFVELVPERRLVFTWALAILDGASSPASTVRVTLTPQGPGTAVRIVHGQSDRISAFEGGRMPVGLTLYDRHVGDAESELRCEWCGRPGQALPFHVRSPEGQVEFAEPVLCAVCQGLIGYLHPHRSEQPQPPEVSEEELGARKSMSREERTESAMRRHQEVHAWAAGLISQLLTERFVAEGRPRPDWAVGPGWSWPPGTPSEA